VLTRTVRGQYGEGSWRDLCPPIAESGVPPNSNTETFVAITLLIDNWRWRTSLFTCARSTLPPPHTSIVINFAALRVVLFRDRPVENLILTNWCCLSILKKVFLIRFGANGTQDPSIRLGV